ncbi:MAG: heparinase [Nitrosomonadaceae bacterium]|nr:heparinase [Nitrosomonadaceae bacterium]
MGWWDQAGLYWHTLRHLRPVQFYGRVWFRLLRPKPNLRLAPPRASKSDLWHVPAKRLPSMTGPRSWVFLNEAGHLEELGWDGAQREKLWRYNQHYFDDLNAQDAADRLLWHAALVDEWIAHNPPGQGNGWEPYPLSLRVVNWVKWASSGAALHSVAQQSLAVQVRWLTGRLENHLLGNHLFANAKALTMAGLFFEGTEADAWLAQGLRILAREVPEQLLPDGGHFERSTMYHALVLEDLLDLVNAAQCFASRLSPAQRQQVADWPLRARELHTWLLTMCHPDGEISLFNDAAFDIAPSVAEIDAYARRILVDVTTLGPSPLVHLKDSGYIRLAHGPAVALLDVAPVGPDYLPGHAHADTLSFELSVGAQRVLVNSGTSSYGSRDERLRQRGTAAHNTVVVNGQDSSEVWGGFRVARRAYTLGLHIEQSADATATVVRCAHNGYARLPGKPTHHRIWRMDAHGLTVTDRVEGLHQSAEARFHFHPAVQVQMGSNQAEGTATLPDGTVITWQLDNGQARLEASTWHPRFGHVEPNVCLTVKLVDGSSTLHFRWAHAKA